jgi:hypothetical protein
MQPSLEDYLTNPIRTIRTKLKRAQSELKEKIPQTAEKSSL